MKLENELIKLFPYDRQHIPFFAKWRRYLGNHFFTPIFPSESALDKGFEKYVKDEKAFWWVITRAEDIESTDEFIGMIGLNKIDYKNGSAEIGQMFILEQHRGQGFMRAAIEMVLELSFNELRLHSIYLKTWEGNEEAIELYKAAGFEEWGRDRESFFRKGSWHDVITMGILEK